jgi:hypothetical protein
MATINELKTKVLENVSADWVRENFGKLTLKETWHDAYDRLSEIIAAKADQSLELTIEAIDTVVLLSDHSVGLGETAIELSESIATVLVSCVLFVWFVILELRNKGAIDALLAEVERLEKPKAKYSIEYLESLGSAEIRELAKIESLKTSRRSIVSLRDELSQIAA